jgi:hypothetical protein
MRRLGLVLRALAASAGALYGSARLLTGSSSFSRAIAWGESDMWSLDSEDSGFEKMEG